MVTWLVKIQSEFKGLSPGYSLEITQLDPSQAEEHGSLVT